MTIQLPYPPSVNHYWVFTSRGVRVKQAGHDYRDAVLRACVAQGARLGLGGRLDITLRMCAPDRRRRDVDNILKATLDALMHAKVYRDDNQIDRLVVERGLVSPGGMVVVELCEMQEET